MSRELDLAMDSWKREVDRVAADLIESGTPSYAAQMEAVEIVKRRRQERAAKRSQL